ncbi:hypothetical protein PTSG_06287 [Salpingoeca rosetta]|uniref:SecA family profile domain-containing protein n=1 Tax=Salpingoeca rosetta (strain ATCC 50818 / BSB-021) TaxID=946362 RepID=F2UCH1_SALR5|nr:uncharacterized protein PTSG_06287 [Salpingoeca rosetta]EGD74278.1 hypothetical protein PTSG_06287 [Salpingoeca rosetta]|eukprot:XP_004993178.1 hypothetical protein PTSG_06287 [Salpingoeca rosetta]
MARRTSSSARACDCFISLRFNEAINAGKALQAALSERGVTAFLCEVPPGRDIESTIVEALSTCRMAVIMGTKTYGKKTPASFGTREELRFIIDEKKPFFYIKMCAKLKSTTARFRLPDTISYHMWQPDNNDPNIIVPADLVDGIVKSLTDLPAAGVYNDIDDVLSPLPDHAFNFPQPESQVTHHAASVISSSCPDLTKDTALVEKNSSVSGVPTSGHMASSKTSGHGSGPESPAHTPPISEGVDGQTATSHGTQGTSSQAPSSSLAVASPPNARLSQEQRSQTLCDMTSSSKNTTSTTSPRPVEHARDGTWAQWQQKHGRLHHRLMYLTPDAIFHVNVIKQEEKAFVLKPLSKLAVHDEGAKLVVKNSSGDTLRIYAPDTPEGGSHLQQWRAALFAAKRWNGNDDIVLPASIKANHQFAAAIWNLIFPGTARAQHPEYRDVWLRWLCNPNAQATFETMHRLFMRAVRQVNDDAAALSYLNHLTDLHHSVHTRMIMNAIDPSSNMLTSWKEHTMPDSKATHKHIFFSLFTAYVSKQARFAQQHDKTGAWPGLLCAALDYHPSVLLDSSTGPSEQAFTGPTIAAAQEGKPDDGVGCGAGAHHAAELPGEHQHSPFDANTTAAMQAEEERLSRPQGEVCSVPLTCFEELVYFFNVDHLRYYACKHWAQHDVSRYLSLLETQNAGVLKHVFDGPTLQGRPAERLCLLLPCLDIRSQEDQAAIVEAFTEDGGLHMGTFRVFAEACVAKAKTDLLAFSLRTFFSTHAASIPDAVSEVLTMLTEPQESGHRHTTAKAFDTAKVLFDAVVVLVGGNLVCVDSFEDWSSTSTDERKQFLVHLIHNYASSTLCKITIENRGWLDDSNMTERAALRARVEDETVAVDFTYERSEAEFASLLAGFVRICIHLGCFQELRVWANKIGQRLFKLSFGEGLRGVTMEALSRSFDLMPECKDMVLNGTLLSTPQFFCHDAFNAMIRDKATGVDKLRGTYFDLLALAEKLDGYPTFAEDMKHLASRLLPHKSKTILDNLNHLCEVVLQRMKQGGNVSGNGAGAKGNSQSAALQERRAAGLKLGDLVQCSLYATDAIFIVQSFRSRNLLEGCIAHYVNNCEPSTWVELFRRLDVIAFFIKYLVRESYEKAFTAFKSHNGGNEWASRLVDAAQEQFDEPIISLDELRVEEEEAQARLIQTILARGTTTADPEMSFIIEFTGRWMQRMKDIVSIPMTPHNTQIITTLMFAAFYRLSVAQSTSNLGSEASGLKSLIAEVGTGEGKSVIIIMMALYFVCVQDRRVHILENNVSLLDRDYSNYKAFFSQFKKSDGTSVTVSTSIAQEADITYCLQEDVEAQHRSEAPKGCNAFRNVVLIVDEVDDLVIDQNPVSGFVKRDEDNSAHILKCFQALKRSGLAAAKPTGCPERVWNKAQAAFRTAQTWREGKDYALVDGRHRILDGRGRPTHYTSATLQYVNFIAGYNDSPSFDTVFYVVSTPHVFKQYALILGLTGSVGGEAEREYLRTTYDAGVFSVPPFLDTCTDACKQEPQQRFVKVVASAQQQRSEVIETAEGSADSVPVLVITPNPKEAAAVSNQLKGRLGQGRVQLLLEVANGVSQKDKWQTIIDQATQPAQQSGTCSGPTAGWRVTVTDYFGGRGHDYKVTDEGVDDAGGLLVIITHIPDSYREWVQWKGRTARQDRNGQLALILNSEEEFMRGQRQTVTQFTNGEIDRDEFVRQLLRERNVQMKTQLDKYADQQRSGMAVNEMCDRFYRKYGTGAVWPANDTQRKLRDFLKTYGHTPPISKTKEFANELDIGDDFPY